jgi:cell division protein FtsB
MEQLGVDALQRRVAELERENALLRNHNAELTARVQRLQLEAQTMHDLIWENARTSSRPPLPPRPEGSDGSAE